LHNTSETLKFKCEEVIRQLEGAVHRSLSDGLLLSGGLDTSIIAYLAVKWIKPVSVTVALSGAPAPDIEYAKSVAANLGLKHYIHYFSVEEMEEGIRTVVRIRNTYDPMEVRNSAAVYMALKEGKKLGLSAFMTGDGADELFGGYSFLFGLDKEQLETALRKMWANMSFSTVPMAKDLGLEARLPFLDSQFKEYAAGLDAGLKVKDENGKVFGKWVLRKAFEKIIPMEILWREKAPIEVGTGTTTLPSVFDTRISDKEFDKKKRGYLDNDGIVLRSKEQLHYYQAYKSVIGVPQRVNDGGKACSDCGSKVAEGTSFCRTCGAYPV